MSSESYGGHYVPTFTRELIKRINNGTSKINFQWSIVGNPLVYLPMRDYGQYAIQIDRNIIPTYPIGQRYKQECAPAVDKFPNPPASRPAICDQLESQMDAYTRRIDPYAMSFPLCVDKTTGQLRTKGHGYGEYIQGMIAKAQSTYRKRTLADTLSLHEQQSQLEQLMTESNKRVNNGVSFEDLLDQITKPNDPDYFPELYDPCEEDFTTIYVNRKDVQKALHADLKRSSWRMCNNIRYSNYDFIDSMLPVYADNAKKGPNVKQLVFSGTDDTMCSTVEAQMSMFTNWKTKTFWEEVTFNGQLIGHKSTFVEPSNLTFITVASAGHMAPSTRPKHTQEMLERFIAGKL